MVDQQPPLLPTARNSCPLLLYLCSVLTWNVFPVELCGGFTLGFYHHYHQQRHDLDQFMWKVLTMLVLPQTRKSFFPRSSQLLVYQTQVIAEMKLNSCLVCHLHPQQCWPDHQGSQCFYFLPQLKAMLSSCDITKCKHMGNLSSKTKNHILLCPEQVTFFAKIKKQQQYY